MGITNCAKIPQEQFPCGILLFAGNWRRFMEYCTQCNITLAFIHQNKTDLQTFYLMQGIIQGLILQLDKIGLFLWS